MSDSDNQDDQEVQLSLKIPKITAECESPTTGKLVSTSPEIHCEDMDTGEDKQGMSLRKRRNLSKNRGQAARQREKTPEPGRTLKPHEDTPTSDDEDFFKPQRNSREIEADNTYQEMKRLVQEKANVKDPVYDLDTDQLLEQRAMAAIERRRRSISPFAIPDKEELANLLERKGSFIDPTNKLLSTNYALTPKDEDSSRRNSLTIEPPKDTKHTLSTPSPSPKESNFPAPLPATPKKLDEIVYPDEKKPEDATKKPKTPVKNESVFTFDDREVKQTVKATTPKPESPASPTELVTKVIQIERTPSKKMIPEKKPNVEVRERIVRTPSRRMSTDIKPIIAKQPPSKPKEPKEETRAPPIKPARSKSASRFGNKTSESEMSEDQQNAKIEVTKRRTVAAPRRYTKNKVSPKVNRSQSVHRYEETRPVEKTGTGMSQTSREIIELMQKARARSLSMPKEDPRTPPEYKPAHKVLKTPNKTPTTLRQSRGMSCPKTIQIISEKEILAGLVKSKTTNLEKQSRQSSGYIDASQSEYTSSCYSSSPSENEYDFDLSVRTAELTHKLNVLSQENDRREMMTGIILAPEDNATSQAERGEQKSVLRKRSIVDSKSGAKKESKERAPERKVKRRSIEERNTKVVRSRWKLIANWQQFKQEQKIHCEQIKNYRNKCICDLLILVIMCGLGGMMFKTLEGSFENAYKCSTRNVKRDFIENLWRGSHSLREEDWKSMARKKLYEFEDQLHTAHEAGVTSYSGQRSWNFMNSFVYCLTLVTTVGYGHIAPKTTYGRVATIVYATIGIPLFLILLADFGKLFTRIIKFFWAFIRRFYYTRSCRKVRRTAPVQEVMKGLNIVYDVVRRPSQIFSEEDIEESPNGVPPPVERKSSDVPPPLPPKPGTLPRDIDLETDIETPAPSVFEIDDEFNLPISVAVFILLVYIIIGAFVYSLWEKWNFFESFYFIFISISTIGLGDLVPDHPMFMMASILYLVFGFALTSMFINVVQLKLSNTFKQASAKLGATIGLKVAEEDGSLVPITPPATEIVPVHKTKTEIDASKSKEPDDNDTKNR
ncbi:serine/arginine repetitive matrix protein 2-like [Trichoplusia ni]|uniref:Serine/arginine repetitive matrix protein 2-like n=1 Tax=Trichoplusia ni TaxID=7111 RepID=A0A7E5VLM8_TRINI|nr:serine/arginine repetitive matrix protein 2-like [Trichoplusia ni]